MFSEFGGDIKVVMANLKGEVAMARISDLLPDAFDGSCLEKPES